MSTFLAAVFCSLLLPLIVVVCTFPFAYAAGWLRVRSVVVVGKDYDVAEDAGEYDLPQICEAPFVADFKDPLAVYEPALTDDEARIARVKKRMNKKSTPTLPGKGARSYVPLRAYKDRKEVDKDHELQIIKNH